MTENKEAWDDEILYYMEDFKIIGQELINKSIATPDTIAGCTVDEIQALESSIGRSLPKSYTAFLNVLGFRAGNFWWGEMAFIHDLNCVNENLKNDFKKNNILKDSYFAFHMHQGYEFYLFDLDSGLDDPIVLFYVENLWLQTFPSNSGPFDNLQASFTDFIKNEAAVERLPESQHNLYIFFRELKSRILTEDEKRGRLLGTSWASNTSKLASEIELAPLKPKPRPIVVQYAPPEDL